MRLRSIAAAQTIPARGDVDANIERHLRLVRAIADEQVDVLVFPELSLTGYELDLADELAFAENDVRLAPLVDAATTSSMTLVFGAPVRLGPQLHIGAFIVGPNGAVEVHTKHHLGAFSSDVSPDGIVPPAEDTVFRPGDRTPLVRFRDNIAAVGVCAESLRESHPKQAADRGANTYLTSHFGIPLDVAFRAGILRGHAVRHSMAVAFANYGGPTGGLPAGGRSAIWSERGELLAELGASGAGAAIGRETEAGWQGKTVLLDSV
jgi:predicted amidohydrolase